MLSKLCFRMLAAGLGIAVYATLAPATAETRTDALVGGPPPGTAFLPTGQYITALAATGSRYSPMRTGCAPTRTPTRTAP